MISIWWLVAIVISWEIRSVSTNFLDFKYSHSYSTHIIVVMSISCFFFPKTYIFHDSTGLSFNLFSIFSVPLTYFCKNGLYLHSFGMKFILYTFLVYIHHNYIHCFYFLFHITFFYMKLHPFNFQPILSSLISYYSKFYCRWNNFYSYSYITCIIVVKLKLYTYLDSKTHILHKGNSFRINTFPKF